VAVVPQGVNQAGTPAIRIPTSALRQEGQGSAVWVLERQTMTVRSQPVQVASADGNEAVIAAGLAPGMLVVAAGVHVLAPGQKVTIWQDRSAAAPPQAGAPATPSPAAPSPAPGATLTSATR
jgi:multidrug efflux system membrane fusion protein